MAPKTDYFSSSDSTVCTHKPCKEKKRRQSGTQGGPHDLEGECTAGRTETWLKIRGPHDSTAIHNPTCLQPILPPTPRLSWVHWPSLNTQNHPGLRKNILPHPCTWVMWRKEPLKGQGPSHPWINRKSGTGPSLRRVQEWLPLSWFFSN